MKSNRLYNLKHKVIAVTGGIATGKSTVCKIIQEMGFPVISADQVIKDIYQTKEVQSLISESYPELINDNQVDFKELRKVYFQDSELKERLNQYIYPELANRVRQFASQLSLDQTLFYEVPLLFEKKLDQQVDGIILVYSSEKTQKARIAKRDHSDSKTIAAILSNQLPIEEKRHLSQYIIENDTPEIDLDSLKAQVRTVLAHFTD